MQQEPNLGGEQDRVSNVRPGDSANTMSAQDERTWSVIAHLSVLVALITVVLSIVTLGIAAFILVPLAFVLGIVPLVHGCYAAYQVSQGVEYRYPFIADRIEGPRGVV